MSDQFDPIPSFSSSRQSPPLFVIVLGVIAMHLLLLGLGTIWEPDQPTPKPRSKVTVQTVRLKPVQSEIAQRSGPIPSALPAPIAPPTPSLPIEQPKAEQPPAPPVKQEESPPLKPEPVIQKEELLPPQPDPVSKKEEASPIQEPPAPKEAPIAKEESHPAQIPAPVASAQPLPAKIEAKPQPKPPTPKPAPKAAPKKDSKPAAPVKKATTPTPEKKITKNETAKPKQVDEAEKKRQQEQAEKKRQQEQADKKRKQEAAEAERKRQQEIAEAERKRQQEIAAAQEAARQKEQALLARAKENLAKMGETRDKISTSPSVSLESTAIPKEIVSLHVDALPLGSSDGSGEWGTKEASYSDEIAYRLKMALKLPDYGAVKIKLTLDRTGKVVKVEIIKSESSKNKAYVESKIPTLLFPSFGQKFQGQSQYTFECLLKNDS